MPLPPVLLPSANPHALGPQTPSFSPDGFGTDMVAGLAIVFAFFGVFLGWALFAHLDAAAYAVGQIVVEGHRQTVQHKDGGTISKLFVKDGDKVKAGQVLVSLLPAEVEAEEHSVSSQVVELEAERARLEAERAGARGFEDRLDGIQDGDPAEITAALRLQRNEMKARSSALASQKEVLRERETQLSRAIDGYHAQIAAIGRQSTLINDELKGTETLATKGYASQNRVRSLQREDAGLSGQSADLASNAARSEAQIGEVRMQAMSLDADREQQITKDLRDVDFQLSDLLPKFKALKTQLEATQIRAPVTGVVVGLSVFTVGGVISPGQKLMDIVPVSAPMLIDAQIPAQSMDGLYVGQQTEVKITSMHDRKLPILNGTISRISADSFTDEKTGAHYYSLNVTVPESEAAKIRDLRGPNGALRPGLPVQVVVPLKRRTAFEYLTEPLSQAVSTSFRER